MVESGGPAKILDFPTVFASTRTTNTGMILGALNYMSPEQVKGAAVDGRSDVFSLGAVFYELMTYKQAFPGDISHGVLQRIIFDEPAPAASLVVDLPAELEAIIVESLKKDPSRRYQDAQTMRRDLLRVRQRLEAAEQPLEFASMDDFELSAEAQELLRRTREVLEAQREMEFKRSANAENAKAEARRRAEEAAESTRPEVVPVFYATDRARAGETNDPVAYGSERSLAGLSYGCSFVSIPPGHRRGYLERPSIFKLEFRENPDRHVVASNITEYTKATFFDSLRKALTGGDDRSTFVFIHGFNVDFNEAVRRTAQLGFDLGLRKAPILYSWPSQGSALQYIADTNAAIWTVSHLAEFLRDLQEQSGATAIHLIAHSMGNQALTGALRTVRAAGAFERSIFKQVVLTAPDLDAEVFERDLAPQIVGVGERTTLYASSRDEILTVSKRLNAYRRAGDSIDGIVVVDGVDSIDASQVSTGLGHSSYGDVRTVIEDLSLLLRLGLPPGSRNLVVRGVPPKQHWAFPA